MFWNNALRFGPIQDVYCFKELLSKDWYNRFARRSEGIEHCTNQHHYKDLNATDSTQPPSRGVTSHQNVYNQNWNRQMHVANTVKKLRMSSLPQVWEPGLLREQWSAHTAETTDNFRAASGGIWPIINGPTVYLGHRPWKLMQSRFRAGPSNSQKSTYQRPKIFVSIRNRKFPKRSEAARMKRGLDLVRYAINTYDCRPEVGGGYELRWLTDWQPPTPPAGIHCLLYTIYKTYSKSPMLPDRTNPEKRKVEDPALVWSPMTSCPTMPLCGWDECVGKPEPELETVSAPDVKMHKNWNSNTPTWYAHSRVRIQSSHEHRNQIKYFTTVRYYFRYWLGPNIVWTLIIPLNGTTTFAQFIPYLTDLHLTVLSKIIE